ncbi:MAG: hypothetical protein A3B99_02640 [Candidatus Yanofskybacteria bacterium RIFCSPHIGHO2_02_FULL_44_12b]|uniref:Isoleucine--tRNA ligase n=2 Tax=Candidatus Yanofskyibacteriota TaxID=1752733 RepID=A0A1F8GLY3_9BACT|nr:MAG: Isoleucine-tRNA ligase [Candidatus Yanofskybacteria bacterium GW2011_GWA2_44_9]OGN04033.1 MAG: hypothetical protein A2659_00260 [Candidatus Yanofskybacteria bacterium RIFCSPHIGHO2_01_FULL_44_24]OGN15364.1 MAG: hypothetical protein A3B99_02640 [Candidatus Yanofskybacteria bacterium RIFCSPHIGHO2_02_FULL_44_12b]OGN25990.1 MAG: hypothetical protein A2925_04640 [Candidatus Yanofskybacteria bacterium RIFCSPLOWO2_01_FULL_44_22]
MYDFKRVESETLDFWHKNDIFKKSLDLRRKGKRFVFFEGPPTANGRAHIGHFLTRVYKDLYCRYKTMRGFFVLRKAGWDTHGLPVEIEIEKELGFKSKKDIENYGIEKFNKKARESVWKYKEEWEAMTRKMGFWLDMKDPYITYENNYIETLWYIIQQIWKKKLLYRAHKVLPFCVRCGTPLSSHEVAQGYEKVKDRSVIIKFKIKNLKLKIKELSPAMTYILAWTTTPWTLPGNVALAVGKDIEYAVVEKEGERYILASDLVEKVFRADPGLKIHDSKFKGSDLVGLEYEPLFDIKELKSKTSYKVYEADFVSTDDGTGVVHTAVMYGEDDYVLGTKLGLPKFHTVDEQGRFTGVGKDFDGMIVKHKDKPTEEKTTQKIMDSLKAKNALLKEEEYEHDYPFCWRCHSPLLYYAKSSWFIKISAVRDQLIKDNSKVNWIPEHIKEGRFGQWLKEGKDWAFSRERYWGTPLPVWECVKCQSHEVLGSVKEIESRAIGRKNTYYIIRHGSTTRDESGKMIISSVLKSDKYLLTSIGKKQVEKAAKELDRKGGADIIFTSPFMRTKETAEIIGRLIHVKVEEDQRLAEIVHGVSCEDKAHRLCPVKDLRPDFNFKTHPDGESWNDVRKRTEDFINDLESKYSGKRILIVGHGDPLWLLYNMASGKDQKEILENRQKGWYPPLASLEPLEWKSLPRNEYGELDLHRPFIDKISIKCQKCGAVMKKVPDLIDVWFDSGAMPYAQWHWPFENTKTFKDQFPADYIIEGIDQTRGWFYTLLAISTLLGKGIPYRNVMVNGHALDEHGKKMSKSLGNVVRPDEIMDLVGVDATRWYFYTASTLGESIVVSKKSAQDRLKGFIFTLQNCVRFYELYSQEVSSYKSFASSSNLLDKWMLSKFNGLVDQVTSDLDKYDPTSASRSLEKFVVEDLSNWWLRRSRKRKEALVLLRSLLLDLSKILAPFAPFLAEDIHRRMHRGYKAGTLSVHLHDWLSADKKSINLKLEAEMDEARNVVAAGLALRKEKQVKVRQPIRSASIKRSGKFQKDIEVLIEDELNVKKLAYNRKQEAEIALDFDLDPALIHEGYVRELIRQMQDMRKEAKYRLDEKVFSRWHSDDQDVAAAVNQWAEEIKKEVLLKEFIAGQTGTKAYDVEKELELAPQKKIWVGVRK